MGVSASGLATYSSAARVGADWLQPPLLQVQMWPSFAWRMATSFVAETWQWQKKRFRACQGCPILQQSCAHGPLACPDGPELAVLLGVFFESSSFHKAGWRGHKTRASALGVMKIQRIRTTFFGSVLTDLLREVQQKTLFMAYRAKQSPELPSFSHSSWPGLAPAARSAIPVDEAGLPGSSAVLIGPSGPFFLLFYYVLVDHKDRKLQQVQPTTQLTTCKFWLRRGTSWGCHFAWHREHLVKIRCLCVDVLFRGRCSIWDTLRFTLHTSQFTFHILHSTPHPTLYFRTLQVTFHTLHSPHYRLYTFIWHSRLYILSFTLYTPHFTPHTPHSTVYTPHSTLYTLHSTLCSPHSTSRTLHFTLYTWHLTSHTLHFTLHTVHLTVYKSIITVHDLRLYTLHSTLHTLHFTFLPHCTLYTSRVAPMLYTVHLTRHTLHSTLCTPYSSLSNPHSTLDTLHSTLYTLRSTLYTLHSTLYTIHTLLSPIPALHFILCTFYFALGAPHSSLYT